MNSPRFLRLERVIVAFEFGIRASYCCSSFCLLIFEETIKLNRIVVMRLVLFLLSVSTFADSLTLKDGRVLSGTYLGGSTTAVRFLVGNRVETYSIGSVDRISFGDAGPASSPVHSQFDSSPHDRRPANETAALTTPEVSEKQQRFCEVLQSYRESVMR